MRVCNNTRGNLAAEALADNDLKDAGSLRRLWRSPLGRDARDLLEDELAVNDWCTPCFMLRAGSAHASVGQGDIDGAGTRVSWMT